MSNREYDYLIKLVIIGNSNVGKSSVLLRFSDDSFSESYLTTIGVDFRFKTLNIDGRKVKLQIWDTAGQERFRTITNAYYKGADGIVLVYDITNSASFEDIDRFWLNEVESYAEKDVELLLLGNKCDLADNRQVETEKVSAYSEKKNMDFYETSAKTSDAIEQAFLAVSKRLMAKKDAKMAEKKKKSSSSSSSKSRTGGSSSSSSSSNAQSSNQQSATSNNVGSASTFDKSSTMDSQDGVEQRQGVSLQANKAFAAGNPETKKKLGLACCQV